MVPIKPEFVADLFGGRVAVVTGAGDGVGKAVAVALAAHGARVVATDAKEFAAEMGIESRICDPTSEEQVSALFDDVAHKFGRLDVLINAATLIINAPLVELSASDWDRCHGVNAKAAFLCSREALRLMGPAGHGRIVIVTAIGAAHPVLIGNAAYSTAKAAAGALCRNIALEHARQGITANAVMTGAVITGDVQRTIAVAARTPSGPGADPARHLSGFMKAEDVVPLLLFLASAGAAYVTGQTIAVDGGFLLS